MYLNRYSYIIKRLLFSVIFEMITSENSTLQLILKLPIVLITKVYIEYFSRIRVFTNRLAIL